MPKYLNRDAFLNSTQSLPLVETTSNIAKKAAEAYNKSSPAAKAAIFAGVAAIAAKLNQSDQCSKEFYSTFWAVAGLTTTVALAGPRIYNQYLAWQNAKPRAQDPIEMSDSVKSPRRE